MGCTFVGNTTTGLGGGIAAGAPSGAGHGLSVALTVSNTILWENAGAAGSAGDLAAQIGAYEDYHILLEAKHNCTSTTVVVDGAGNTNADPMFVFPGTGDFRLRRASPLINAGKNDLRPTDIEDLDDDSNELEPHPLDLDGLARTTGVVIDIGAYEGAPCLADLNGDGVVDGLDLTYIMSQWGCQQQCSYDLTGDDQVDGLDLTAIFSNWGPCSPDSGGSASPPSAVAIIQDMGYCSIEEFVDCLDDFDAATITAVLRGCFCH